MTVADKERETRRKDANAKQLAATDTFEFIGIPFGNANGAMTTECRSKFNQKRFDKAKEFFNGTIGPRSWWEGLSLEDQSIVIKAAYDMSKMKPSRNPS